MKKSKPNSNTSNTSADLTIGKLSKLDMDRKQSASGATRKCSSVLSESNHLYSNPNYLYENYKILGLIFFT